jgi:hypothetical protein
VVKDIGDPNANDLVQQDSVAAGHPSTRACRTGDCSRPLWRRQPLSPS